MTVRHTLMLPVLMLAFACASEPAEEADSMVVSDSAAMEETAPAPSPMEAAQQATDTFVAAFNAGDAAGVAATFTEDGILMPSRGGTVEGRAAIEAAEAETIAAYPSLEVEIVSAETMGDGTLARGTYALSGGEAGEVEGTWMGSYVTGADGATKVDWLHVNEATAEATEGEE